MHGPLRRLIGLAAFMLAAGAAAASLAQTALPAMKFVTASLVTPAQAETKLGTSTAHTNSLANLDFTVAPEIVATAAALKSAAYPNGDPDLIFEYVHNLIETEFAFGERKGALGTLIDKSGTPFDQNALFVALLTQAGITANYQIGTYTLSQPAFTAWTGVSDLGVACRMLASSGIAATFSPAVPANCQTSGAFKSVTIFSVWTQVTLGSGTYYYDPAYKTYQGLPPINLATASGYVAGTPASDAASGMTTGSTGGVPYIQSVNAGALDSYLASVGKTLLDGSVGPPALPGLKSLAPDLDTHTVVGIPKIVPTYAPPGGWRITTAPGTAYLSASGANGIPDQFRSQLTVELDGEVNDQTMSQLFVKPLFVDDIDGRRLGIDTNFDAAHNINPPGSYTMAVASLVLDDTVVATWQCNIDNVTCFGGGVPGQLILTATHPYPAGSFADDSTKKMLTTIAAPVAIVSGWGRISPARLAKWSDEVAADKPLPFGGTIPFRCEGDEAWCRVPYVQPAGDFTRQKLAASWLAQLTEMARLQAAIGDAIVDFHHSIGVVDWRAQLQGNEFPPPPSPQTKNYLGITDEFTDLNIDTALSVTANGGAGAPAISRSIALASATLEGSVLEQMEDLPDTASTASRFAWGNNPGADNNARNGDLEDPCWTSSNHTRPFYNFSGTTANTRAPLYQYEGSAAGCGAGPYMLPGPGDPAEFVKYTEALINSYVEGWTGTTQVTGSAETFLGPGSRFGPAHVSGETPYNDPSSQRGGAIVATQFDAAGDVLQVAHVLSSPSGISKGGGGKQPQNFSEYDPSNAADALKDRFVDRSVALGVDLKTGTAGYTTPTLLSVGTGSVPYKLDYALSFKAAPACTTNFGPCTGPVEGGWNQSWDVRFSNSGSGLEAMGATTPFAATDSFVAFIAMQDIFGQSGLPDLNKDVFAALVADWWRQQMVANTVTVNRGFSGAQYIREADGHWAPPVGSPGTLTQSGARVKTRDECQQPMSQEYPFSTSRRWDHSGVTFSLASAGGDVLSVAPWSWQYEVGNGNLCAIQYGYEPTTWTWPQGVSLNFTYDFQQGVTGITTSLGRSMTFTGAVGGQGALTATANGLTAGQQVDGIGDISGIADAAGEAWSFDYTSVVAREDDQRPVPYPQLYRVFEPVNPAQPALTYSYDTRGLVDAAADATALQWKTSGYYHWYLALGGRGERDDPQPKSAGGPGAYTVYYDTDGNEVRNIDELGREVDSVWDGRHRVTSRTFPEGDQELFAYTTRDDIAALTKVAKPGSGLASTVVRATYDPTWNKLASITDAMGNETTFAYYPGSTCGTTGAAPSMMCMAQRPAPVSGGTQPTFTYQYDAIGLPTQSVDPTGVTTTHAYDGFGNLTSTTEAAAAVGSNPALNLTTTFTPDGVGNVTAVVDPRGNATTTQYDAMRRKTAEQDRNGGGSALPLAAKAWTYDLNGRMIEEQRATGFDNSGNPTGWQNWLTSYTPTGKVARTTDPLGEATVTTYDAVDRPVFVTDAAGHVSGKTYDLAGEELSETSGVGTPLFQTDAAFTYGADGEKLSVTDANSNTTQLAYDGFNRLSKITFADQTTEASQYDKDGDLTIWTNRGGYGVVRCYDALNRKVSESGITGASSANQTLACPTGGTANTQPGGISPRTFTYDLAGRLTGAAIQNFPPGYTYDAAGRPSSRTVINAAYGWDHSGNLQTLTYPDGATTVTYQYDALNRMTGALIGGNSYGSLSYDALGRRQTLTFQDGSTQTWGYDAADHVTSIAHVFPNQTADNVTFTYGYDPAGREVSKTVDNSLFAYSPPATGTTAYGAANALNQYPTVGGYPYSYQPDGGLKETDTFQANYDELGKATITYLTPTPGTVDPNNYDIQGIDALDHVYFHYRVPSAGATYPFVYHWTDGLRPETIQEPLCQQTQQTPQTAPVCTGTGLGNKTYVLGPDPDERWAMIGINGGTYNPHTDRAGTLIALSNGGNVSTIYAYDAYGQNASAANDASTGPAGYLYRYTGQRLDPNTGFYDYKARDYSPKLGRFIQPDPAGLDQGPNLYAYVDDDPVNAGDPSGLCNTHGGCYGDSGAVETGLPAPGSADTTVVSGAVPGSGTGAGAGGSNVGSGSASTAKPTGGSLQNTQLVMPFPPPIIPWGSSESSANQLAEELDRLIAQIGSNIRSAINDNSKQILYHYTDEKSASEISATGTIRQSGGKVYVTDAALSPQAASDNLFAGMRGPDAASSVVIMVAPRDLPLVRDPSTGWGMIHYGSLRDGRHVGFLYVGPNPFRW